jgi:hypothetical protein
MLKQKQLKRIEEACNSRWLQTIPNSTVADRGHAQMPMLPCCSSFLEHCRETIPNNKMLFLARRGRLCEATRSAVEAAYFGEGGRRPFGFGGGDGVYRRFRNIDCGST